MLLDYLSLMVWRTMTLRALLKASKECGWVSDEINVDNVDEVLEERETNI